MRWWWSRPAQPGTGRDVRGRLFDGDRVRPEGWPGWWDLLPARPSTALDEPTQLLHRPLMTPGQRWRSRRHR